MINNIHGHVFAPPSIEFSLDIENSFFLFVATPKGFSLTMDDPFIANNTLTKFGIKVSHKDYDIIFEVERSYDGSEIYDVWDKADNVCIVVQRSEWGTMEISVDEFNEDEIERLTKGDLHIKLTKRKK